MNLVILGPQGCGKGTQAELLAHEFGLHLIEMGAELRREAGEDTLFGRQINEIINIKKELVSNDIIALVLRKAVASVDGGKGIILDGVPRKKEQIKIAERVLEESGRKLHKVIYLNIPDKESVVRISKRFSCSVCGEKLVLGEDVKNPSDPCPLCNGKISQREDDTPSGVMKRLQVFHAETIPVIEHYRNKGKLIEIDGVKSVDRVFQDVVKKLQT